MTGIRWVDGIAVIGMAGRFPAAADTAEYWANLRAGRHCVSRFDDQQLAAAGVSAAERAAEGYVAAGGVLADADLFDAELFGMSPREAEVTDPQQRIALECAWQALEDAGLDPARTTAAVGVFAGTGVNTYFTEHVLADGGLADALGRLSLMVGNEKDHVATRIAYRLGLRGPAVTVQTACSTSLVAVHLACQSLLAGDSDVAIAGGARICVPQEAGYVYDQHGINSPDGHCRAFDRAARGTVGGNGVGMVVLKRAAEAIRDGDAVRAVIRGSAVNNDGAAKVGYTAPGIDGQAAVIRRAHRVAGVEPHDIDYVEAHGTGTEIGDAIEVAALGQAFRTERPRSTPCLLGSVKPNIGHLDAAAGVAGLIKVVLALGHEYLPPSIDCVEAHPEIPFADGPFEVVMAGRAWPRTDRPRRAGVSSFGIGGTNAHLVVEEAPERAPSPRPHFPQLLPLSADSTEGLAAMTRDLVEHLAAHPELDPPDVAHTLQYGRARHRMRGGLLWASAGSLVPVPVRRAARSSVCLLFPGQGSQYEGMAAPLYAAYPRFRETVDECCARLVPLLGGLDLRRLLLGDGGSTGELDQTRLAQPALFVTGYAVAQLLASLTVEPTLLLGHSVGEYAALCIAGGMSLADALRLVAARGRLMQEMPTGAMLAVSAEEEQVRALLPAGVEVAAVNAARSVVVAGPPELIDLTRERADAGHLRHRRLRVSHAFHTAAMDGMLDDFRAEAASVTFTPTTRRVVSNVTGQVLPAGTTVNPGYLVEQLRRPVRFADGIERLAALRHPLLIEAGPGRTLITLASGGPGADAVRLATMGGPDEPDAGLQPFLGTVLGAWAAGVDVAFPIQGRPTPLPGYRFQRRRHWLERTRPGTPSRPLQTGVPHAGVPHAGVPSETAGLAEALGEIWQSLLGGGPPTPETNFFDAGGDSLLAVRMIARVRKRLAADLEFKTLLETPTFGDILGAVHAGRDTTGTRR
ncbi:Acyl transferase domain-containing protein [Micromonospora haikouensis]|uniref:Acyl transferase domain-containing protein n=1 Tax=Micromonospora haikouensis TaxID=686309 RepID=A0A1C4XDS3_9ACTN|nr:type I polyketide synthase [Micromonospora haikouensis]SCF06663.1 Acyl transferase domain-containing protein [Micromonospora haikouensis]